MAVDLILSTTLEILSDENIVESINLFYCIILWWCSYFPVFWQIRMKLQLYEMTCVAKPVIFFFLPFLLDKCSFLMVLFLPCSIKCVSNMFHMLLIYYGKDYIQSY